MREALAILVPTGDALGVEMNRRAASDGDAGSGQA
jgi:hypothetical protein